MFANGTVGKPGALPCEKKVHEMQKAKRKTIQSTQAPKQGLKVLFTPSDNDRSSGAFLSMLNLARILREKYDVQPVVVLPGKGNGKELLDEFDIPSVLIPSRDWVLAQNTRVTPVLILKIMKRITQNFFAERRIARFIRDNAIDLVHNNTSWGYVGAAAALRAKTPLVWHIREFLEEDQDNRYWNKKYARSLMAKSDRIIAISKCLAKKYAEECQGARIVQIYNGIDPEQFFSPNHIILQGSHVEFVLIGVLFERKGQLQAIQACSELKKRGYLNFGLMIVGEGENEYLSGLRQQVKTEKLEDTVSFYGYCRHPKELLEKADVLLMCSKAEAFGRVTVEAMLAGLLVIGSNTGGTVELIEDGVSGLLYEAGNARSLADQMEYAINHPVEMRAAARVGQQRMLESMTAELNAKRVYETYLEVLNERKNSLQQ